MNKSICIVRLSALGDVLMLVPLVRTLQAHIPEVSLTWIISRPAYELVEGMGGVEFIVIDKPNSLQDYWRFAKQMKQRQFDVLIAAQSSFRANLLYPFIRAKRKIGYDKVRAKDGHGLFINERILPGQEHTLEGFLKFATALGIQQHCIAWDLPVGETARQWAKEQLPSIDKPVVIINAASSKPERSWLVEGYVAVIEHIRLRWQAYVVLVGGPGEHDKALSQAIQNKTHVEKDIVGKTRPKQLLALMERATLVLCPDTGPSHMAAAVGTPVIALQAVTSASVSGPYPYRHLAVDYYDTAVKTILKQPLEQVTWGTHVHGSKTMALIKPASVIHQIDTFMSAL